MSEIRFKLQIFKQIMKFYVKYMSYAWRTCTSASDWIGSLRDFLIFQILKWFNHQKLHVLQLDANTRATCGHRRPCERFAKKFSELTFEYDHHIAYPVLTVKRNERGSPIYRTKWGWYCGWGVVPPSAGLAATEWSVWPRGSTRKPESSWSCSEIRVENYSKGKYVYEASSQEPHFRYD